MATITEVEPGAITVVGFSSHRIMIDRFEKMIEAGAFDGPERIFLWDGGLYEKMTPGNPHVYLVTLLHRLLDRIVPDGWFCLEEKPIAVGSASMPEPDVSVVRGMLGDFRTRRPTSRDISLLVEVSDTSLPFDSGAKLRAYAANGIPVYWIVDIAGRRVIVHGGPGGPAEPPAYRERTEYGPGESVPVVLDGREAGRVAVADLFPGAAPADRP